MVFKDILGFRIPMNYDRLDLNALHFGFNKFQPRPSSRSKFIWLLAEGMNTIAFR